MLNILIPTDFSPATIQAIKIVNNLVKGQPVGITLLYAVPISDSITHTLFLRRLNYKEEMSESFQQELDNLKQISSVQKIEVHCQYGITPYLFNHVLEIHKIDLTVIPFCQDQKRNFSYKEMTEALKRCTVPSILLPETCNIPENATIGVIIDNNSGSIPEKIRQISLSLSPSAVEMKKAIKNQNEVQSISEIIKELIIKDKINVCIVIKREHSLIRSLLTKKRIEPHKPSKEAVPLLTMFYN